MCSLPIVSPVIPFCYREVSSRPSTYTSAGRPVCWADYPRLVDLQTRAVDQLLDESVENVGLAPQVKKAEMASSDLITLVMASSLSNKDQVAEKLSKFSEGAGRTGRGLHSLGTKIQGAVDL